MKKLLLSTCLLSGLAISTHAQKYLGLSTSNWGGISSIYLNPANAADNRDKLVIDILNVNVGIDNSLGKINSINGVKNFIQDENADLNSVFTFSKKREFSLLAPYFEMRGPGVMVTVKHKHSFALTTRLRGTNQFNHFDQTLYRTILDTGYVSNGNIDLHSENFNWTAHLWGEVGFTYATTVVDKGHHLLKAGATVRYLAGVGYLGLKGTLDAHYNQGADSFSATGLDMQYASNILNAQGALGVTSDNFFSKFFGKKQGSGIGGDMGLVYDYIDEPESDRYDMDGQKNVADPSKNRYKFRVSASVTDLGYISYNEDNNYGLSVSGSGNLTGKGLSDNVKNFDDFRTYAKSKGFKADTGYVKSRLYMPSTFILSADYHIKKSFYVNAMYMASIVNRQNFGNSYYDQVTVTPRYDRANVSIAVPVTYSTLTENLKLGIGARYKGIFIGSDDMLVFLKNKQYGLSVYAGAFISFHNRKPKDMDGDHVSDKRDRCPGEQGLWENHGCPGREDTTDNCPEAEGLATMADQEDKDSDGDGIPDISDACPTVAGVAEKKGCPATYTNVKTKVNYRESTIKWHGGKNPIDKSDYKVLDRFAKLLKEYPQETLIIEGYRYNHSTNKAGNMKLAKSYAETAKTYIVGKGIDGQRVTAIGNNNKGAVVNNSIVVKMVK